MQNFSDVLYPLLLHIFSFYLLLIFNALSSLLFLIQDSPDAVKFLVTAASIFGPHNTIHKLTGVELDRRQLLLAFNEIFIPWCLQNWSASTSSKLDLLLALIDDKCFLEQWNSIITYAIDREGLRFGTLDTKLMQLLAVLMEKARDRIRNGKYPQEWQLDYCQNELLDIAALSVINANPPFGTFETQFLRYVDETHFFYMFSFSYFSSFDFLLLFYQLFMFYVDRSLQNEFLSFASMNRISLVLCLS